MGDDAWNDRDVRADQPAPFRSAVTQQLPAPRETRASLTSAYSPALAGATEVVGLVRRLADAQGRDDLVEQLDTIRGHLGVEPIPVVIMGGSGQGKSSLINALVGAGVCPVGPNETTAAPIALSHANAYSSEVVIDPSGSGRLEPLWRPLEFSETVTLATNAMNPNNQWGLRLVELGVPSPTLARGLVLIDTPPIREVWVGETTRMLSVVSGAAAVILVTSAGSPLSPGELDLLRAAAALCHRVVVVMNGTNAFPGWRSVVDQNQLLLEQRGVPAKVFAVAAMPYWGEAGGVPPGPDSGIQSLASYLEESVVLDREHQRISKALVEAFWAADRLRMRLFAERALIGDGVSIAESSAKLRHAAHSAQELCNPIAAWHRELTEGMRQLRRDMDDDLSSELARLSAEADQHISAIGTTVTRDAAHLWLHRRVADAVVHIHRVRKLAVRAFCKRVADHFQRDWAAIVNGLDMASEAHSLLDPRLDRPTLTGTRGFAELPLRALSSLPPPPSANDPRANDPQAAAHETFHGWLRATEEFLRSDTDATLQHVTAELAQRCQSRGIELHRSIIEVFTTLNLLGNLEPEMVLQRHEELASDLEQLKTLDFQLHRNDRGPSLGY